MDNARESTVNSNTTNGVSGENVEIMQDVKKEIKMGMSRFKSSMMVKFPFYGNFLVNFPIIEDENVKTACTNGACIQYNPLFFATLTEGERNFVLLHEVLHIMLLHCVRGKRAGRIFKIWNIAIDFVVNDIIRSQVNRFKEKVIVIDCPAIGYFLSGARNTSADSIYVRLMQQIEETGGFQALSYVGQDGSCKAKDFKPTTVSADQMDSDIIEDDMTEAQKAITQTRIEKLILDGIEENRALVNGITIPEVFLKLVETKRLPWEKLLRNYLSAGSRMSEESSYSTPERKYLHMDMIVPGLGHEEEDIEEVWAFVDSSQSISDYQRNQFVTQLYRIMGQFNATINLAYWDTEVSKVYKGIQNPKDILESKPLYTGATDISCIYRFIMENKVDATAILVFTDGMFGRPSVIPTKNVIKNTIFVLTGENVLKSYPGVISELGEITCL